MLLIEREADIPEADGRGRLIRHFASCVQETLGPAETPVRFAVTRTRDGKCHCELGVLTRQKPEPCDKAVSIFDFLPRKTENQSAFNAVLVVPTGIGAEIGGHAGDAGDCPQRS
jgi:hypothetical protein